MFILVLNLNLINYSLGLKKSWFTPETENTGSK